MLFKYIELTIVLTNRDFSRAKAGDGVKVMIQYQEYVEEIAQASKYGKLVFFVGAGLSTISGYPQWGEIVDEYYRELYETLPKKEYSSDECLKIPQIYYDIKGKEAYNRILKRVFEVEKKPNTIHYKILAMNPAHIITTNYDNLLEKTCTQRGKYYRLRDQ